MSLNASGLTRSARDLIAESLMPAATSAVTAACIWIRRSLSVPAASGRGRASTLNTSDPEHQARWSSTLWRNSTGSRSQFIRLGAITLDLYSHVLPGMQADAAARVDLAAREAINRRLQKEMVAKR